MLIPHVDRCLLSKAGWLDTLRLELVGSLLNSQRYWEDHFTRLWDFTSQVETTNGHLLYFNTFQYTLIKRTLMESPCIFCLVWQSMIPSYFRIEFARGCGFAGLPGVQIWIAVMRCKLFHSFHILFSCCPDSVDTLRAAFVLLPEQPHTLFK